MTPLSHQIYLLGRALAASADQTLRLQFDIGFTDYLLLRGVVAKDLRSQGELAGFVGVGEAGVSRIVTRLVARGALATSADPQNRRRSIVVATAQGERLQGEASATLESRFGVMIDETIAAPDDVATFERVLSAILSRLEANR